MKVVVRKIEVGKHARSGNSQVGKFVESGKLSWETDGRECCSQEKDVAPREISYCYLCMFMIPENFNFRFCASGQRQNFSCEDQRRKKLSLKHEGSLGSLSTSLAFNRWKITQGFGARKGRAFCLSSSSMFPVNLTIERTSESV